MSQINNDVVTRNRAIFIASISLNVLLVGLWVGRREQPSEPAPPAPSDIAAVDPVIRTNVTIRQQFFSWEEVESEAYPTYIENLRRINCPEQTIRDIIIADVDDLYAERYRTEVPPASQQWWQDAPDPDLLRLAEAQRRILDQEREVLLTRLLGPDWNAPQISGSVATIEVPLDGPTLGSLPDETKEAVQVVSAQAQQTFEAILDQAQRDGAEPNPAAIAALQQSLRMELAPLLGPRQLEEVLIRYAPTAHRLREELATLELFNVSEDEFRRLFLGVEKYDLELMQLTADGSTAPSQRTRILEQRRIAFQNALGPARYAEYERLLDPDYRAALAAANEAGNANAAGIIYAIDMAGKVEQANIRAEPGMTPLQREIELKRLELEQLEAAAIALGQGPPPELPPLPQRTHSFRPGDTVAEVSVRYGVPVDVILRANPNLPLHQSIEPGTQIVIPSWQSPIPPVGY